MCNHSSAQFCGTKDFVCQKDDKWEELSFKSGVDTTDFRLNIVVVATSESELPSKLEEEKLLEQIQIVNDSINRYGINLMSCFFLTYVYDASMAESYGTEIEQEIHQKYHIPGTLFMLLIPRAGPGPSGFYSSEQDLVCFGYSNPGNGWETSVIIHEMGHYFGLPHTHNFPGSELVDGSNCQTAGDGFCDTPADPNINGKVDGNCEYIGEEKDANGHFYLPPTNNYMSYSAPSCLREFSQEQTNAIQLNISERVSQGLLSTCTLDTVFCMEENEIFDCAGFLHDGSGSAQYGNNTNCSYLISTSGNEDKIKLSFLSFNTSIGDSLFIYDGEDESAELLVALSGSQIPDKVTGSSNKLFLRFITDNESQNEGWMLQYDCFEGSEIELIVPNGFFQLHENILSLHFKITNSGTKVNETSRTRFRLKDGANLADTSSTFYTPTVHPKDTIDVFHEIDLCVLDVANNSKSYYLLYYNLDYFNELSELDDSNHKFFNLELDELDPICSTCLPDSIFTTCSDSIFDGSPANAFYEGNLECSWSVHTNEETPLDIYFSRFHVSSSNSFEGDSLIIYDGPDATSPILARFNQWELSDTLNSSSGNIHIEFKTDGYNLQNGSGRGWKLHYKCSNLNSCEDTYSSLEVTDCDFYVFPSTKDTAFSSGPFKDTIQNEGGCDSIISLEVQIISSTGFLQDTSVCDFFQSATGNIYEESGVYFDTLINHLGCDSIIETELTVFNNSQGSMDTIVCDSFAAPDGSVFSESGNYVVSLENSNGCDSLVSISLEVVSISNEVQFQGDSLIATQEGAAYQWIDCETWQIISNATDQWFKPNYEGYFKVLIWFQGCWEESECVQFLGVEEEFSNNQEIFAFPNPSSGLVYLSDALSFELVDSKGKLIRNYVNVKSFNISDLAEGVYFIRSNFKVNKILKLK